MKDVVNSPNLSQNCTESQCVAKNTQNVANLSWENRYTMPIMNIMPCSKTIYIAFEEVGDGIFSWQGMCND